MTEEPFANKIQRSCRGTIYQTKIGLKGFDPIKVYAHTCISSLNLDDNFVGSDDPTVETTTGWKDSGNTNPMCFCSKASSQGSNTNQSDQLLPVQQSKGDQTDESGVDGLDDTHLLAPVLKFNTESDTPHLAPGKTEGRAKKWLL
jgi:hypothetical protein